MSDKSKKILKYFGYLLLTAFFWLLLKNTNFSEIILNVKKIPFSVFSLLLFLQIITQVLLGLQWHGITKIINGNSSFFKIMNILTSGSVVEAITPGAKIGGEAARFYYLKKDFNATNESATNIIIIQKSISMSVLFTICFVSFMYIQNIISADFSIALRFSIQALCFITIAFLFSLLFFANTLEKITKKFTKLNKWVKSYADSVSKLSKKQWIFQFIISFLVWILFPLKMVILSNYLNLGINFLIIIAITMTSYMVGMLPLTPGGIGTFEGVMILLLSMLSIENSIGFTVTIVFRFVTFWFVILTSLIYVLIYKRSIHFANRK